MRGGTPAALRARDGRAVGGRRAPPAGIVAALLALLLAASVAAQTLADLDQASGIGEAPMSEGVKRPSGETPSSATALERQKSALSISQAGAVDPATYTLGPGDVLQLELWGRLVRTVVLDVSPDGKIFLSGSGPLQVAGQTLEWAQAHVKELAARTFRGVNADLRLVRLRTFRVYVSGFVSRAGSVEVTPVTRASEALAYSGLAAGASRRNIEVRRLDGSRLRVDLDLFELDGRQDLDPLLRDGDVLNVPRSMESVTMMGALMRSRSFELVRGDSLSRVLRMAGGLLPSAARDRALFARFASPTERESTWLEVPAIESGEVNPVLRDGDALFVPFVSGFHDLSVVEIYGEVMRPGAYPMTLGRDRLSDLIRWSAGFKPMANRSAVYLVRMSGGQQGTDVEFERLLRLSRSEMTESEYAAFRTKLAEHKNIFRVDYDRLLKSPHDTDPLLRPGDVVRVDPLVLSVRVDGEVKRPGLVEFVAGRSVDDYVALAGGYSDRASRGTVRVSRSLTGQVIPARSLKTVQPGDFIWVPERRDIDPWTIFRDVVAVAGQVAVIILATKK